MKIPIKEINIALDYNLTEEEFNGTASILGDLYMQSLTSIPEGFNPTVGGNLYLNSITSIPEGFNPTVGGNLYLNSLTSIPEWFNPAVGGNLYLNSITSIPEWFNPAVGGDLYLNSLCKKRTESNTQPLKAHLAFNSKNAEPKTMSSIGEKVIKDKIKTEIDYGPIIELANGCLNGAHNIAGLLRSLGLAYTKIPPFLLESNPAIRLILKHLSYLASGTEEVSTNDEERFTEWVEACLSN